MKLELIKTAVTSRAGLAVLAVQQKSPTLLLGAGVVGVIGTVVLASRATLQLDEVIDKFETRKKMMHDLLETVPEDYTPAKAKSDSLLIHTKLVTDVVKLYGPAVVLGSLSIAALVGSHVILSRRNAGLIAAYTAIDKAFKEYRSRVVADQGEEKDLEYMYESNTREVYSEGKKGEPKVEEIKTFGTGRSPYSVVFDADNLNWGPVPETNVFFLRQQQQYCNDRLRARGHLFLNDVYRELGFPDTEAGAVTGWIYGEGDDFIDFGIWEGCTYEQIKEFLRGPNGSLLLDFNVQGSIYKRLPNRKKA